MEKGLKKIHKLVFNLILQAVFAAFFLAKFENANAQETKNSYGKKYDLNGEIAREIENILLFSNDENERIDLLSNQDEKDDFKIDKVSGNKVDFQVSKKNIVVNLDVKTKEKIAYNAYLNGQYEVAIELYKQIVNIEPDNNYAKYSLALIYQKMGQFFEAKNLYRELLKVDSENREEVIANMLIILSKESPRDAIYLLSRLSQQHPNSAYLSAQTALVYNELKNYKQAINYLEQATKKEPERVDYKYNLAIMYDKNKEYKMAAEAYYDVIKNYGSDEKWEKLIPIEQVRLRLGRVKDMI